MRSLEWAAPAGTPPPVFLHDSRITEVRCEKNAVTFCFADGFSLVENGQLTRAGRGLVTFSDCQPSDFFVWRVTGHPSRSGLQLRGKEIPLEALDRRFFARHGFIELFAEMYSPTACTGAAYSISRKSAFGRERTPISSSRPWAVTR